MRKNGKYISISEYCKANGLKPTKFYEALSRHPELAKKLKTNAKGERVLDEKAITAAGAILRKENRAKQGRSPAVISSASAPFSFAPSATAAAIASVFPVPLQYTTATFFIMSTYPL